MCKLYVILQIKYSVQNARNKSKEANMIERERSEELLELEPLVRKINGQAIAVSMTMEECVPSEAVWAGVVLTDLTKELLERYEKIQLS